MITWYKPGSSNLSFKGRFYRYNSQDPSHYDVYAGTPPKFLETQGFLNGNIDYTLGYRNGTWWRECVCPLWDPDLEVDEGL